MCFTVKVAIQTSKVKHQDKQAKLSHFQRDPSFVKVGYKVIKFILDCRETENTWLADP